MPAAVQYSSALEVPRLTSVLRSLAEGDAKTRDLSALAVERSVWLREVQEERRKRSRPALAGPSFQAQVLGDPAKAPKDAKTGYSMFLRAVGSILGGSEAADPEEVQEALPMVWQALVEAGPPDARHLRIFGREKGRLSAVSVHQQSLTRVLGFPVTDSEAVADAVDLVAKLQRWQAGGTSPNPAVSGLAEFGADLEVVVPPGDAATEEAVLFLADADAARPVPVGMGPRGMLEELLGLGMAEAGSRPTAGGDAPQARQAPPSAQPVALRGFVADAALVEDEEDAERSGGGQVREGVTVMWLQQWVATTAARLGADSRVLEGTVCRVLLGREPGEVLAAELMDVLGPAALDAIGDLVARREALSDRIQRMVREQRTKEADAGQSDGMPVYGRMVTVSSERAKQREKALRKERRKGRGAATDNDLGWLLEVGLDALVELEQAEIAAAKSLHGTDGLGQGDGAGAVGVALPVGTQRRSFKGYEEVRVPAAPKSEMGEDERLVRVAELDGWAQSAFEGYEALNRIQSRLYPVAYHSNENMLVCAPTGAGKTNIAMLAVLHEVAQHMRHGVVQKGDFKVVYVAPMKALAAEVTATFGQRLSGLGLKVRELTGDMQLSRKEMEETQMIVTTPEKWDVITRKGGDAAVAGAVRLLIIDEVHLLNDDRGSVIETLVARTQRQVEATQSMIRIVGLSATLPNYRDVAAFLSVNLSTGLFFFDASYRPVPLETQFIGVSEPSLVGRTRVMNQVCWDKVAESLRGGYQAMVFVHSRKETGKTARTLADLAAASGSSELLLAPSHDEQYGIWKREVSRSRNRELQELFDRGVAIHHAGMLRSDRNLVERLFSRGVVRVLCCTATLAWGVNLPAHTVVIKGTQMYDPQQGCFTEVGMLDVQQIFGRAGRPQYNIPGVGIIITTHDKLARYLGMLTHSAPIESHFEKGLVDNLNAEVVLGTVTNVREACTWLSYTYMHTRMTKNPLAYGVTWEELQSDPGLELHRRRMVERAAKELDRSRMVRFDERSGNLYVTELGRVASHYYVRHKTVVEFNERLRPQMSEAEVLDLIASSAEFEQMNVREDEIVELERLARRECPVELRHGVDSKQGKANALLQSFVSRARIDTFSLVADMNYVAQNAPRIARALLEIAIKRGWPSLVDVLLAVCKSLEQQCWPTQHPLRQFPHALNPLLLHKLEDHGLTLERLWDMDATTIERIARHPRCGRPVRDVVDGFPDLSLDCDVQPITRSVLRVVLRITPEFKWRDGMHGGATRWHIWVEDAENEHIYHHETWALTKKMHREGTQPVSFTIPVFEPLPPQYFVRVASDTWLHAEAVHEMRFDTLVLPDRAPAHTALLDLDPLPRTALRDPSFEALYRFSHFNPIQTQAFHALYHSDDSVLMGAPTGSGKTVMAELAMLRLFKHRPDFKVIYIAPLKALVRERIEDWGAGLCRHLGKRLVELTGDHTPDMRALLSADVIVCTPEKWDGISRSWHTRGYVRRVGLLVIDEIHLLGQDRGPVLEVIVSRMRYIAAQTGAGVRFVGLSTALANAEDLAAWLGVKRAGLFNFKPSVRPVPMEVHIQGYPGKHYCPRMATMNKPCYAAIQMHSPSKPVLVFVSSRRQTRLTALDLIAYAAADGRPRAFVHMGEAELEAALAGVRDASLRHTLGFGIGLHHAGLTEADRKVVEGLFVEGKIQVLVATSTLAWGVNTPTHLVIVKGTEFYDAPTKRYVDFPITDVLQMMGRAGRPQFDKLGVAVVMVHEPKKGFYKKFLYEPFPVESSLLAALPDHLNAEVAAGTVATAQDAIDYLTWTYWFRRLVRNPSFYGLPSAEADDVSAFLSETVEEALGELEGAGCVVVGEEGQVRSTTAGRIASFFYLRHETIRVLRDAMGPDMGVAEVLEALTSVPEFDDVPVRHNEDSINAALNDQVRFPVPARFLDSPHAKANLLLQSHLSRLPPPISDYTTDARAVMDNAARVLQAMVDLSADAGWLGTTLSCMLLAQALTQARWPDAHSACQLPGVEDEEGAFLASRGVRGMPDVLEMLRGGDGGDGAGEERLRQALAEVLGAGAVHRAIDAARRLPAIAVTVGEPRTTRGDGGARAHAERAEIAGIDAGVGGNVKQDGDGVVEMEWPALGAEKSGIVVEAVKFDAESGPAGRAEGHAEGRGASDAAGLQGWATGSHEARRGRGQGDDGAAESAADGDAPLEVEVRLERLTGGRLRGAHGHGPPRVYAPLFPKAKEEGWWVVAGDRATRELLAMRRVSCGRAGTARLRVPRTNAAGRPLERVWVFVVSDSYLGLDQEYEVEVPVEERAAAGTAREVGLPGRAAGRAGGTAGRRGRRGWGEIAGEAEAEGPCVGLGGEGEREVGEEGQAGDDGEEEFWDAEGEEGAEGGEAEETGEGGAEEAALEQRARFARGRGGARG